MLPKHSRLSGSDDFARVYKHGRRVATPLAAIFFLASGRSDSRIGFVVSKKQIRRIVDRNRARRKLREQTKQLLTNVSPGYDIVIQGRGPALRAKSAEINQTLTSMFKRAKLWKMA